MTCWDKIVMNFRHLMQETITNYVHHTFDETPSHGDILKLPNPLLNGAYSITSRGNPVIDLEVNSMITMTYIVRLQLGFIINQENKKDPDTQEIDKSKSEYHDAVSDVEQIVVRRMNSSSYQSEEEVAAQRDLDRVDVQNIGELVFADDIQNYATCDLDFTVRCTRELEG